MANIKELDEALKAKKEEKIKSEKEKKIKQLMKVANKKANDILTVLEKRNRSVRFSELFLQNLSGTIDSAFLSQKNKMKVKDLSIFVQIPDKDETEDYKKVLSYLNDLPVIEASKILEGMSRVIDGRITQDKAKKTINELEVIFSDNEQPKA